MGITIAFALATGTMGTRVFSPALIRLVDDFMNLFTGGSNNRANEEWGLIRG
jgi:hypothetical protein